MNNRLSSKLVFILSLFFLSFIFLQPVQASNLETYEVSSSTLNVRSGPSSDSEIVAQFVNGNELVIFQEKYGWVQTYLDGEEVWVARHHLVKKDSSNTETASTGTTNTETSSDHKMVTITSESIFVRSGPGTSHEMVSSAVSGDNFEVTDKSGDWYQIMLSGSETGWIASWLTDQASHQEASQDNNANAVSSNSKSLEGYNIVVDPGHGGTDPGAIGFNGIQEKDVILPTSTKVIDHLRDAGANVIVTRTGDNFVLLDDRVRISNSYYTDAFISLHYDSSLNMSANGVTTYFADIADKKMGESIQSSIISQVSLHDRGVRQANYKVLVNSSAPSVLLELGFISNPHNLPIVQTESYQNSVATGITNGLITYFE
ncbi:N-acetylmuramoyl-L-alanine amidase [Gracilibacillus orientalis]|uniref:N-acetylmuramoyl-L-alanine amidase n=1 Tax=Gracilibacillus orientalis TaxID=334253 RepID=A0A1I4LJT8_9BACI|nr:N-acetylmuramoyl-L-alanine amidase [Gracilibacillus orientalis]SFL91161.1 N-acetylmuramoyl-L-alanine amidase [Gracilibacillus orientalis]